MSENKSDGIEVEAGWIRQLAAILYDQGLTEIELEKGAVRLRVSRAAVAAAVPPQQSPGPAVPPAASPAPPASPVKAASHPGAVNSPMVGTAYLKPAPEAAPFVKIGDQIAAGQTLMIIEAMKTMNPIAAPRGGVVREILVADSAPVEFGEALMIIE